MSHNNATLDPIRTEVKPGHIYRHRKGGLYFVKLIARIESTLEPAVVYVPYREPGDPPLRVGDAWVRPLSEFTDGRFTRVRFP